MRESRKSLRRGEEDGGRNERGGEGATGGKECWRVCRGRFVEKGVEVTERERERKRGSDGRTERGLELESTW